MKFSDRKRRSPAVSVRTLAALDLVLHGPRFVLAEFGVGVLLPGLLGLSALAHTRWHSPLGWYLLGLALNYVPLLAYAARIARAGSARREAGAVAADRAQVARYSRRQLWLLVPLAVAGAALWQEAAQSEKY